MGDPPRGPVGPLDEPLLNKTMENHMISASLAGLVALELALDDLGISFDGHPSFHVMVW